MSDHSSGAPGHPEDADEQRTPDEPVITPADAVVPPPPPEIPIPEGLLTPPPPTLTDAADRVIPPPPADTRRRADRPRPTPAILEGEPPAAVADDWAQPSVAPEVPTSGGYGGIVAVIFVFLLLLFVAAVGLVIYLLNTTGLPFASVGAAMPGFAFTPSL